MQHWWRRLWRQTDHFDWFSAYLRDRGLRVQWRLATFLFTACLSAVPVVMIASPAGPDSPLRTGIAIASSVSGVAAASLWLIRWPTRAQSLLYNVVCCGVIAAGCLMVPNPYGGLMACTMFAALGGFLAYFNALGHVVANFCVALACITITASRMWAQTGDVPLVAGSVLLVLALNLGVPFGIQSLVHSLHTDLRNSGRDPLTGLLNRRSFYNAVHELIDAQRELHTTVNVTMVDLDRFKKLNDTCGHAVGDAALVNVAAVLRDTSGTGAVLSRLGGEEFVIADVDTAARHAITSERVREGIAAMPFQITASLGICSATVPAGVQVEHPEFIDQLIRVADAAMYDSKRSGGNRVMHRRLESAGSKHLS